MSDARGSAGRRRVLLRRRSAPAAPAQPVAPAQPISPGAGKGRPTPKRNAARGRHTGPVAPPPTTRREAAKRMRGQQGTGRRGGGPRGPGRELPRDAGPVRAYVRDVVDSRRNLAVLLLPVALLLVLGQLTGNTRLLALLTSAWVLTMCLVIGDTVATGFVLHRRLRAKFPEVGRTGGHVGYGLLRTTVFRRFRMPGARVRPAGLHRRA